MLTLIFILMCGKWKHLEEGMWGVAFITGILDMGLLIVHSIHLLGGS